jgi:hypothetical protein
MHSSYKHRKGISEKVNVFQVVKKTRDKDSIEIQPSASTVHTLS